MEKDGDEKPKPGTIRYEGAQEVEAFTLICGLLVDARMDKEEWVRFILGIDTDVFKFSCGCVYPPVSTEALLRCIFVYGKKLHTLMVEQAKKERNMPPELTWPVLMVDVYQSNDHENRIRFTPTIWTGNPYSNVINEAHIASFREAFATTFPCTLLFVVKKECTIHGRR